MNPTTIEQVEYHGTVNVASAAARANVEHLTYLSGGNTSDHPIASDSHLPMTSIVKSRAEDALRRSGVPYTFFRSTMYMETLPQFVRGKRAVVFGKAPYPFSWIAADEYARLVGRALGNEQVKGKALFVKGPEALTLEQTLTLYRTLLAPSLTITHVPLWSLTTVATVSFSPTIHEMAKSMRLFGTQPQPGDASECDRLLGPLTETLEQWCRARSSMLQEQQKGSR